ncbi:PAS domain S-box-containing protein/diguanylate cyclase (GGDEF)-like protein [Halanaerobium saccharolyticum]|uniref:PAS domain S-box-containing protein/diguanylate cyclase (GGDEF)-like protein n=1 Tax=Halanaerobium saccharolyticum TaxID=43595 RepID=A0A4R7YV34_9FIRM|nr:sensor domain-containing diguanylate cyclase [Halanaerobium saccharolyticum]RAK06961.1 PAS domain S-box-containing protein/diguanylate cyclase (GGDEF)-like protein [Halanaerobium saccharolyticum]TDW01688.1 PAS domain S-box-containing protein/diguanylate cyclase (GGDEF)-like protein [Halanaerobium saccharolyticum]TDX53086.1 PAS domain S-box-containing protein/diguanylate cyclase (GGDEF)-like protein [Halanaerobium saccharolyticum]
MITIFEDLSIETVFNNLTVGIVISNKEGSLVFINDLMTEITGYSLKDIKTVEQWFEAAYDDLDERKEVKSFYEQKMKRGEDYNRTLKIKTKAGDKKYIEFRIKPLNNGYLLANLIDVSKKVEQRQKIEYLSFHDELTGVYNRHYLKKEIDKLNSSKKYPVSIIIGDLDNLKKVNDKFGHLKGDFYIKKAAEIIKSSLRSEDILARVGGDEFVILLAETTRKEAEKISDRITTNFEKENHKNEYPADFKISLGISTANDESRDIQVCYELADKNMYKNKKIFF